MSQEDQNKTKPLLKQGEIRSDYYNNTQVNYYF